jgi:hypothetical protein
MLLFRSLTIGLIGACFLMQLERLQTAPPATPSIRVASVVAATQPVASATIIDVAGGVSPRQLSSLVHLDRDERVLAVDDRAVDSDLEAGAAIAAHANGYIDLTVGSTAGGRRVLMILH